MDLLHQPDLAPDLLLLDRSFGKHSARVAAAFLRLHRALGTRGTILEFDSSATEDDGVEPEAATAALRSAQGALFYGHGHTELSRAGEAVLVLGRESELRIDEIAQLDLRNLSSLTLVACASGQQSPFVGPTTLAHAAAIAGARQILFSLWPITPAQGARFAAGLLGHLASGRSASEHLASLHTTAPLDAAAFGIMEL
jgi:hypothetical protein